MTTETFANGRLALLRGRIATLTLNVPATRNAMTRAMWGALPGICAAVGADPDIRVLIVTGAEGAFCAGADISEFEQVYATEHSAQDYNTAVRAGQAALRNVPQPVIAMIDGACVGGGCGLALCCDLRFASQTAIFAITPAKLGIAYSPADTAQLIEKVGVARAKDILFSARKLTGAEALSIGLVDALYPADALQPMVMTYAENLADLSPVTLRATKAIINGLSPMPEFPTLETVFTGTFAGKDFVEGRTAFLERRKPRF